MTFGGWINLILSVGAVTILFVWCLYKVLSHNPPAEDILEDSRKDFEPPAKK